jgi:cyclic pyranopterin phosphate synthase
LSAKRTSGKGLGEPGGSPSENLKTVVVWPRRLLSHRTFSGLLYDLAVSRLSHVDDSGDVSMVDVGSKPLSKRRAVARASVRMASGTAEKLDDLPKGDVLVTAQLAGIMAAKRTAELIPLCHPLPLTHVDVGLEVEDGGVGIEASAETTAQTGVEMEALTAAVVAALTVYDMAKAIDKEMVVEDVRLLEKTKDAVG